MAGGGPGTVVLDTFGPIITGAAGRDFTAGRDLVMFDQRGVGFPRSTRAATDIGAFEAPDEVSDVIFTNGFD